MLNIIGEEISKDLQKKLNKVYKTALRQTGQNPHILETTLEFVYSGDMQELNKRTRNVDDTTDVLSFPALSNIFNKKLRRKDFKLDVNPENHKLYLGDIVINLDRVISQAQEYGHSREREVCYLFVHGILHLLEYDHMNDLDKSIMRAQEEKILSKLKIVRG